MALWPIMTGINPDHGPMTVGHNIRGLRAERTALRARVETLEKAMEGIANWCEAYPASVFPQASADAALASCKAAGIPVDAMHGTWARHLLTGIGRDARAALEGKPHD